VAPKKPDALLRAEQFLRAAEEEVTVLAGRSFDVRLVKILQLIVLPEEGSGGKDDDKKL